MNASPTNDAQARWIFFATAQGPGVAQMAKRAESAVSRRIDSSRLPFYLKNNSFLFGFSIVVYGRATTGGGEDGISLLCLDRDQRGREEQTCPGANGPVRGNRPARRQDLAVSKERSTWWVMRRDRGGGEEKIRGGREVRWSAKTSGA